MSYESHAEPIRIGVCFDFKLPGDYPEEKRNDFNYPLELVFREAYESGLIDRPIEIVTREIEGLPKGSFKHVVDGFAELVEEGCVLVYGPFITDNSEPLREEIETRFKVPVISNTGSENFLGHWTFSLPQGSMADEPVLWAQMIARRGLSTVGIVQEQSLIGEHYVANFRKACKSYGLSIIAQEIIPQTAQDVRDAVVRLHEARPDALVHAGFGFGVLHVNPALKDLDWDPPRFMGTAFQNAWLSPALWDAILGWTGCDNYDEGNKVGQAFLDRYEAHHGRRPEYCVSVMNHDFANVIVQAIADARPLTPKGIRDAIERIKMLPAAGGAPGTRISFGNYLHRGWAGTSYLVARKLDPDGVNSQLVERFGD